MTLLPEKNKHYEHGWTGQSYQQRAAKRADSAAVLAYGLRALWSPCCFLQAREIMGGGRAKSKNIFFSFFPLPSPSLCRSNKPVFQINFASHSSTMKMMMINLTSIKAQSRYTSFA